MYKVSFLLHYADIVDLCYATDIKCSLQVYAKCVTISLFLCVCVREGERYEKQVGIYCISCIKASSSDTVNAYF